MQARTVSAPRVDRHPRQGRSRRHRGAPATRSQRSRCPPHGDRRGGRRLARRHRRRPRWRRRLPDVRVAAPRRPAANRARSARARWRRAAISSSPSTATGRTTRTISPPSWRRSSPTRPSALVAGQRTRRHDGGAKKLRLDGRQPHCAAPPGRRHARHRLRPQGDAARRLSARCRSSTTTIASSRPSSCARAGAWPMWPWWTGPRTTGRSKYGVLGPRAGGPAGPSGRLVARAGEAPRRPASPRSSDAGAGG